MLIRESLRQIEKEMNEKYINRADVIHGLLVTLLANGNIILLGPAGTGKTDMVETLARTIDGKCFETLLTKTSSPEELVGPLDIKKLEGGEYERVTRNTLVDSQIGYVDETFKGSSPTLNILLPILAQRTFRNGTAMPTKIPLMLFVGASNELPDGGTDGNLAALWDRFEMRYVVDYLKDEGSFARLLKMSGDDPETKVNIRDIAKAQKEVLSIKTDKAIQTIVDVWHALAKEGYRMSDRKWRNSLRYMKANAWLAGRKELASSDVLVLKSIAWQTPEQIKDVARIVYKTVSPMVGRAQDLFDSACEIYNELSKYKDDDNYNKEHFGSTKFGKLAEVHKKLTRAQALIANIKKDLVSAGKETEDVDTYMEGIHNMLEHVAVSLIPSLGGGSK